MWVLPLCPSPLPFQEALLLLHPGPYPICPQMYASVVTTLLALMDGVVDRGNVIVIGATNRPESIDSALRRPGRFDREVYVDLPSAADRAAILNVHTRHWQHPPRQVLVESLAAATEGFAGADLAALCTGAVLAAARRLVPGLTQIVDECVAPSEDGDSALHKASPQLQAEGTPAPAARPEMAFSVSEGSRPPRDVLDRELGSLQVTKADWAEALLKAPPPCSLRQGLATLTAEYARPAPSDTSIVILPALWRALRCIHASGLALQEPLAQAAAAAAAASVPLPTTDASSDGQHPSTNALLRLEKLLAQSGAVEPPLDAPGNSWQKLPQPFAGASVASVSPSPEQSPGRSYPACRVLLCGRGDQGQPAAAGALLCLAADRVVIGLPQMLDAGAGNVADGALSLLHNAASRAPPGRPLMVFLPHLEAWALEAMEVPEDGEESGNDSETCVASEEGGSPALRGLEPLGGSPQLSLSAFQEAVSPRQRCFHHGSFDGLQPPPGLTGPKPDAPNAVAVEAVKLTMVWQILQAAVADVCQGRPAVVLATCSRAEDELPADMLRFFSQGRAPQAAAGGGGSVCLGVVQCKGGSLSRYELTVLSQRVASKAGMAAATGAAAAAHLRLGSLAPSDPKDNQKHSAGPPPVLRQNVERWQAIAQQRQAGASQGGLPQVNEATLEWGRSLGAQVQAAMQVMGRALMADRRSHVAASHSQLVPFAPSAPTLAPLPKAAGTLSSFRDLGQVMAMGGIATLEHLRQVIAELHSATQTQAGSQKARAGRRGRAGSRSGTYKPAPAAAAALRDILEAWAHQLACSLGLYSSSARGALAAAQVETRKVVEGAAVELQRQRLKERLQEATEEEGGEKGQHAEGNSAAQGAPCSARSDASPAALGMQEEASQGRPERAGPSGPTQDAVGRENGEQNEGETQATSATSEVLQEDNGAPAAGEGSPRSEGRTSKASAPAKAADRTALVAEGDGARRRQPSTADPSSPMGSQATAASLDSWRRDLAGTLSRLLSRIADAELSRLSGGHLYFLEAFVSLSAQCGHRYGSSDPRILAASGSTAQPSSALPAADTAAREIVEDLRGQLLGLGQD
mmetsp:Transcript_7382/g.20854  ORF Transcript_7382/g.20854 Transcript_7382/m.20854 type:complete len:1089 (-) Transcript_7382:329-3595(-)